MTEEAIQQLLEKQRAWLRVGMTLNVSFRIQALTRLQACIQRHEADIAEALRLDLGKSNMESYMCETGLALDELRFMRRHIRAFSREKTVRTPLAQFHSRSFQKPSPRGVALIMSPWNYPFLLTMTPLIDALAAGNTVVLKPSAYSPHTSALIASMLRDCFPEHYVAVVTGGREENASLLRAHFDTIFFTGSQAVGREVLRHAAEHLTPVTLELGGKSPCIVDQTANLKLAAKRIVFGKFLNCGQTCVAPDFIYCHESVKDALAAELQTQIIRQFGTRPLENPDYGKIINEKHFDRILGLLEPQKVIWGGASDRAALRIEPTILDGVTFEDPVMNEEIFGPLMPILTFNSISEAIRQIQQMPHPLACYIFTRSRKTARRVYSRCAFGGGCINDTVIHLATSHMGFGGFGESGMGAYHGRAGFDAFTHYKSVVDKKTWLDLPIRYQPYRPAYQKLLRFFLH